MLAHSSVVLDPARLGDAASIMITDPTIVSYEDPRHPDLDFRLDTGRFVAIEQAAGWVYGIDVTPQLRAASIAEAVAAARAVERALGATGWRRDPEALWHASDSTIRTWVMGTDDGLQFARFTAGSAEVRVSLDRTGAPTPSEHLLGKDAETFYVDVGITDLVRLDAYHARVLRARTAQGDGSRPLPLSAFMNDTTPP